MKNSRILITAIVAVLTLMQGCTLANQKTPPAQSSELSFKPKKTYGDLVVGFAQIGAESEWRTADTDSIKQEAERLGVELKIHGCTAKT